VNRYTNDEILRRFTIIDDVLNFTSCSDEGCSDYPKRPFFETGDNAAVRISGKYYNTYGEVTISLKDKNKSRPFRERYTLSNNAGIIPYLFDSSRVVYLVFIYNLINKNLTKSVANIFDENLIGDIHIDNLIDFAGIPNINDAQLKLSQFRHLIQKIKDNIIIPDSKIKIQNFFYLFYFLLKHFNSLIKGIYENNAAKKEYVLYIIIDDNMYNLLSTVNYLYDNYNNKYLKDLLIICNLDPLCHDNGDNHVYRLLMIYNLIKKARGTTRGLYDLIEKIVKYRYNQVLKYYYDNKRKN
jgi:hypothetical protein